MKLSRVQSGVLRIGMEEFEPTSGKEELDAGLLRLALAGDENAFRSLYDRLKTGIFRYAFYMTSSSTTARRLPRRSSLLC